MKKSFKTRKENLLQCCNAKGMIEYVLQESKAKRDYFYGLDDLGEDGTSQAQYGL